MCKDDKLFFLIEALKEIIMWSFECRISEQKYTNLVYTSRIPSAPKNAQLKSYYFAYIIE
jgi:hypothetical protein